MINCYDCRSEWKVSELENQFSPAIKHKEITLDIDATLIDTEYAWEEPTRDFQFKDPDSRTIYYIFKRPHLDHFMAELQKRFDKINFFTSATEWYAKEILLHLNIAPEKMGWLKTRKDCVNGRPLSFDREYIKNMDNSLMIDDKFLVVEGYNNTVIKINPFHHSMKKDTELLDIISLLNKEKEEISCPKVISGEVSIYLRHHEIEFKNLPWEKHQDLLEIVSMTQAEIDLGKNRTKLTPNYFTYQNDLAKIGYTNVSFESYLKIQELLKGFTESILLSEEEFNSLTDNYYKKIKSSFNDDF